MSGQTETDRRTDTPIAILWTPTRDEVRPNLYKPRVNVRLGERRYDLIVDIRRRDHTDFVTKSLSSSVSENIKRRGNKNSQFLKQNFDINLWLNVVWADVSSIEVVQLTLIKNSATADGPRDALCQLKIFAIAQLHEKSQLKRLAVGELPWRSPKEPLFNV